MSGKAPKQKGNRIERECVNLAKGYGFESRRAWGSDGRSLGWHEEVDMTIDIQEAQRNVNNSIMDIVNNLEDNEIIESRVNKITNEIKHLHGKRGNRGTLKIN